MASHESTLKCGLHGLVGDFEGSLALSFCSAAGVGQKQEAAKFQGFLQTFQVMLTPSVDRVLSA